MVDKKDFRQVRIGAILSYSLIILNTIYALLITPYILKNIGVDEYGVYKVIASLSSSLTVLDFGLGGTVQRYVANYRARGQDDRISNFTALSLIITVVLNVLIVFVSIIVYYLIAPIYGSQFNSLQIVLAQKIFIILVVNLLFTVVENVLNGVITGHNDFLFGNGVKIISLLLRIILVWWLLKVYKSAITIVSISLGISVVLFVVQLSYVRAKLKVKIKLVRWDKSIFVEAGKYTGLMFLTAVASQIFSNVDNLVIGALCGPSLVAVYSIGLQFFGMFQHLSSGIAGVMLPTVTKSVIEDEKEGGIKHSIGIVIKAGKVQFILLGAALTGFICIGKDFILQWLGREYEDVYIITLILLVPSMFELCVNVCHSILRAKNKIGFRTSIVIISACLNALLTYIFIKVYSYIGAAVATAVSYVLCSLIAMNIYYSKVLHLPMLKIYKGIIGKIWICLLISGGVILLSSQFIHGSWPAIFFNILLFIVTYGLSLLFIECNRNDRLKIPILRKIIKKN